MSNSKIVRVASAVKRVFQDRQFMHYNPAEGMKVIRLSAKAQALGAAGALVLLGYTGAVTSMAVASPAEAAYSTQEVAALKAKLAALENDVAMKAAVLRDRQDVLARELIGEEAAAELDETETAGAGLLSPFEVLEARQFAMVDQAATRAEGHIAAHSAQLKDLGIPTARFTYDETGGMGGPDEDEMDGEGGVDAPADARFRDLFQSWKKLDTMEKELATVPSFHPVEKFTYTSGYGVRFDPFKGTTAMHQGVDMAGRIGEPIYAAGDGKIVKAGWSGGYGQMVEIDHGKGITTRYGHMSRVNVRVGDAVKAGEKVGGMGSTGRSTGSHLHFEVRLDGRSVNPMPFLEAEGGLQLAATRGDDDANRGMGGE